MLCIGSHAMHAPRPSSPRIQSIKNQSRCWFQIVDVYYAPDVQNPAHHPGVLFVDQSQK